MPSIQPIRDGNKAGLGAGLETFGQGVIQAMGMMQRGEALQAQAEDRARRTAIYEQREARLAAQDAARVQAIQNYYGQKDAGAKQRAAADAISGLGPMGGMAGAALSQNEQFQSWKAQADIAAHAPDLLPTVQRQILQEKMEAKQQKGIRKLSKTLAMMRDEGDLDDAQLQQFMQMSEVLGPEKTYILANQMRGEAAEAKADTINRANLIELKSTLFATPYAQQWGMAEMGEYQRQLSAWEAADPFTRGDPPQKPKMQTGIAGFIEWFAKNVESIEDPATQMAVINAMRVDYNTGRTMAELVQQRDALRRQAYQNEKILAQQTARETALRSGGADAASYLDNYGYDDEVANAAGQSDDPGPQPNPKPEAQAAPGAPSHLPGEFTFSSLGPPPEGMEPPSWLPNPESKKSPRAMRQNERPGKASQWMGEKGRDDLRTSRMSLSETQMAPVMNVAWALHEGDDEKAAKLIESLAESEWEQFALMGVAENVAASLPLDMKRTWFDKPESALPKSAKIRAERRAVKREVEERILQAWTEMTSALNRGAGDTTHLPHSYRENEAMRNRPFPTMPDYKF